MSAALITIGCDSITLNGFDMDGFNGLQIVQHISYIYLSNILKLNSVYTDFSSRNLFHVLLDFTQKYDVNVNILQKKYCNFVSRLHK